MIVSFNIPCKFYSFINQPALVSSQFFLLNSLLQALAKLLFTRLFSTFQQFQQDFSLIHWNQLLLVNEPLNGARIENIVNNLLPLAWKSVESRQSL
jgi:hypothetical protein